MRINEMISGVRSDVAAILYGDDFDLMVAKASEVERALQSIPGAEDVRVEQVAGQPVLQIRVKQDEIARYGITAGTIMNLVHALETCHVGEVYEGQLRFSLIIRLPEKACADPDAISRILVSTVSGDWCDKHSRPDSQCFECHPENFEKFAARYVAKFGEQPAKPTE